jgi:hypothetical protein
MSCANWQLASARFDCGGVQISIDIAVHHFPSSLQSNL